MERITKTQLRNLSDTLSRVTGAPTSGSVATVGALLIETGSKVNGRAWKLVRISNELGGQSDILRANSASELFNLMHAYMNGYEAAQR